MRRFLIFVLCGPVIGFLFVLLYLVIGSPQFRTQLEWRNASVVLAAAEYLILLPFAYLFGLPCALAAWGVDALAARAPFVWRLVGTSLTGMIASSFVVGIILGPGSLSPGLVAAAACSTLAALVDRRDTVVSSKSAIEPR